MFSIELVYTCQLSYLVSCFKTELLILLIIIIETITNDANVGEMFSILFKQRFA